MATPSKRASTRVAVERLAKLSPPRLFKALPRERLFEQLDAGRSRAAVWVQGPPGAGKSTLVASYIAARKLQAIWYHIDEGDRDPATFFYYLGLAAAPFLRKRGAALPLLTPEFLGNVAGFSRRYFQTLFALLPKPAVVALDNYEDVDGALVLQGLVEQAVQQIPDGINLLFVSRTAPLQQFSALLVKQRIAVLEADALLLTPDETRRMAAATTGGDDASLARIQARMGGWAAGTALALDRMRRADRDAQGIELDSREAVFDYFAGEVFERAPAEHRQVLLATAFLPSMTVELAQRVSGSASAGRVLNDLYRRHLFVDRRAASVYIYRYHALFQEFLRERARETLSPERVAQLIGDTARALRDAGSTDEALELFVQAGDWPAAARLLLTLAARWLQQGRGQTLRQRIDALPQAVVESDPWLAFWYAASLVATSPAEAMRRMGDAYARFERSGDRLGQVFAAAGAIEACVYEFADFAPLDDWIAALDALLDNAPAFPSPDHELRVYTSTVTAALVRQPGHRLLSARVERMGSLLPEASEVNGRVNAAQCMLAVAELRGSFDDVPRAVAMVEPLLDDARLWPLHRAHWYRRLGYLHYLQGRYESALDCLRQGQEIARRNEFHAALALDLYALTLVAVALGDVELAQAELTAFEAAGVPARKAELAVWHHVRSLVALYQGDFDASFAAARAAAAAAINTGWPQMEVLRRLQLAFMYAEVGDPVAATAEVRQAQQVVAGTALQFYDCGLMLAQAYIALKQEDETLCHALLRRALGQARATGYVFVSRFLPDALPRLFEQALAAGIEVDYTREVIRRLRIPPTPDAGEDWPWPLKLRTLGAFEAWVDDKRIAFQRKAQRKPLDLLKALVAMGGSGVALDRLATALWPDADGDAARKALETTLYRVRKLVQHDGLIRLSEGKLTLDARRVWVDVWAFERELRSGQAGAAQSPPASMRPLTLYRGHFLEAEAEGDEPWMLPMRLRLRGQLFEWLRARGRQLEDEGDREAAEALYRRGLDIDATEEGLYRRLMISHRDRGEPAEALRIYERCRDALARLLGTRPSDETEIIRRSLEVPPTIGPR